MKQKRKKLRLLPTALLLGLAAILCYVFTMRYLRTRQEEMRSEMRTILDSISAIEKTNDSVLAETTEWKEEQNMLSSSSDLIIITKQN